MGELLAQKKDVEAKEGTAAQKLPLEEITQTRVKEERKIYTHDEAFAASLDYFNGDELAARVWVNKYALKDSFGNLYERTPDDMHHRMARENHRIELK